MKYSKIIDNDIYFRSTVFVFVYHDLYPTRPLSFLVLSRLLSHFQAHHYVGEKGCVVGGGDADLKPCPPPPHPMVCWFCGRLIGPYAPVSRLSPQRWNSWTWTSI